jgi:hypothetical protein
MGVLSSIWYGNDEPPRRSMMWAKPVGGGFAFYIFDGRWKPQKIMNDQSTTYIADDTPIPVEDAEINRPYANIYIGIGETAEDVLLPDNLYESIKTGSTIQFTNALGYIFALSKSDGLPKLSMNNFYIPADIGTITIEDVSYNVFKSKSRYTGNFVIEVN